MVVNQNGKIMEFVRCEPPNRRVPTPHVVMGSGTESFSDDVDVRAALEPLRVMYVETLHVAKTNPEKLIPLYNVQNLSKGIEALLNNWDNKEKRELIFDALAAQEIKMLNRDGLAKYQIEARFAGLGNISDGNDYPLVGITDDGELYIEGLGNLFNAGKKLFKSAGKAIKKGVQHKANVVKKTANFVVKNFQKQNPVMIIGRTAYRGLIALNYRGWATIIDNMVKTKSEGDFKARWTGQHIGGNWGDLMAAVNKGKNKKPLLISEAKAPKSVKGLGEAFSAATAVTAATSIITALASYIKKGTDAYNAVKGAVKSVLPPKKDNKPQATEELPMIIEPPQQKSNKTIWIVGGIAAALAVFAFASIQSKNKTMNGLTIDTATIS